MAHRAVRVARRWSSRRRVAPAAPRSCRGLTRRRDRGERHGWGAGRRAPRSKASPTGDWELGTGNGERGTGNWEPRPSPGTTAIPRLRTCGAALGMTRSFRFPFPGPSPVPGSRQSPVHVRARSRFPTFGHFVLEGMRPRTAFLAIPSTRSGRAMIVALGLGTVVGSGCAPRGRDGDTIRIGIAADLKRPNMQTVLRGAELAIDQLNAEGGRRFELAKPPERATGAVEICRRVSRRPFRRGRGGAGRQPKQPRGRADLLRRGRWRPARPRRRLTHIDQHGAHGPELVALPGLPE